MSCTDLGTQTGLSVKVNHMLLRLISQTGNTKPCRIIRLLDHFAEKIGKSFASLSTSKL